MALELATVLIVSDDPEFSRSVTGRWQSERVTPGFTLMGGDLCQGLDEDAFDVAIVGGVRSGGLTAVLQALDLAKPVVLVCDETQNIREIRESQPRDRFFGGKFRSAAVQQLHSANFQSLQTVQNCIEITMHCAEEATPQ